MSNAATAPPSAISTRRLSSTCARGIPNEEARRILIEAFVREAVELVEPAPMREHLLSRIARRLASLEE
jgi:Fe-S cluster assembly scaffold protein SufB